MKKFLFFLISIIIIIGAATLWRLNTNVPEANNQEVIIEETGQPDTVTLIIDFPVADDKIMTQPYAEDQTVFDLLLDRETEIEYKEYDFGNLVTSIGGLQGGIDDKYWIYYINHEVAQVGASDYTLNPGDVITWRFEEEENIYE